MRPLPRSAPLLVLAFMACGPTGEPADPFPPEHRSALADSIAAQLDRFSTLTSEGTREELTALYSDHPDFRFYESGRLQYASADGVGEALAGLPPGGRLVTAFREVDIQPMAPGVAVSHALYETEARGFGEPFSYGGAMTLVWIHEADGWRIRSGHTSSPAPRER